MILETTGMDKVISQLPRQTASLSEAQADRPPLDMKDAGQATTKKEGESEQHPPG